MALSAVEIIARGTGIGTCISHRSLYHRAFTAYPKNLGKPEKHHRAVGSVRGSAKMVVHEKREL